MTVKLQTDLIPLIPVLPTEIKAIEFLKKTDMSPAGAAVVVLASYEGMSKAALADGRELRGHNLWAVKDVEGMRSLRYSHYYCQLKNNKQQRSILNLET